MPTIQDRVIQADRRDLLEARYNRERALARAGLRRDDTSIANYSAAAAWADRLEKRVAQRRRTLG